VCEREWEVFLRLGMESKSCCSVEEREVGVSIYRWGSKTSLVSEGLGLNLYFPKSNFGQDRLKKVVQHTFTKD
jgi:hypothetical protein